MLLHFDVLLAVRMWGCSAMLLHFDVLLAVRIWGLFCYVTALSCITCCYTRFQGYLVKPITIP